MKKLTISKIGVMSLANFLGLMGVVTGAIKAIVLPVLALIGSGGLSDVDAAVKSISAAVSADISSVAAFGIGGWIAGWAYAWIANWALKATKGIVVETK
jgi:hypothetical protein|tara:strand:+ start:225 stop:521 length:297 start_codon:yes stop_codon:yes gene_type:complete